jgi:myo-inositol-1(or 4)-monophosphatase
LDLLHLAQAAATRAATYVRGVERPAGPSGWTVKGARDFVTEVDRTAEQMITEILLAAEPSSRMVGEELNPELVRDGLVWIVDPLDGTTNFLHDFPAYAVSVAAAVDGRLEAGVVIEVPSGDCYRAARGQGAWLGDRRLSVSTIEEPEFALIGTGFPFKQTSTMGAYVRQFSHVAASTSGIRRPGSAALDLAHVAAGRFDAFWEQRLSAWDLAAGVLLVREAGGVATDFAGRDIGPEHTALVAGNPAMHAWLLGVVQA